MSTPPNFDTSAGPGLPRFVLHGDWLVGAGAKLEETARALVKAAEGGKSAVLDLTGVGRLDTAGAWLLDRTRVQLTENGVAASFSAARPEHELLLREAHFQIGRAHV